MAARALDPLDEMGRSLADGQARLAVEALEGLFRADAPDDAWHPVGTGGQRLTAGQVRQWIAILDRVHP